MYVRRRGHSQVLAPFVVRHAMMYWCKVNNNVYLIFNSTLLRTRPYFLEKIISPTSPLRLQCQSVCDMMGVACMRRSEVVCGSFTQLLEAVCASFLIGGLGSRVK